MTDPRMAQAREILVVDDEIGIRELLSEILQDEGYRVALAENASEARAYRQRQQPALVLLDIWMPDTDGVTLLREWGSTAQLTMPVIMMSGHGTIETAVEATRIGAFDFLEKPIGLSKLLTTTLEHPQPWLLAVPREMPAEQRQAVLASLQAFRPAPMPVLEHVIGEPFRGLPWVLFVDSFGVLRAAAEVNDTTLHTRVEKWARMFRNR